GREEPIRLWTPRGSERVLEAAINLGADRIPFEVRIKTLRPGERVERGEYDILPFRTHHGPPSLGYAIVEKVRLGRFNPERAGELGIPEGPLWGRLHRGEPVTVDGRTISADDVVGAPRPGRTI